MHKVACLLWVFFTLLSLEIAQLPRLVCYPLSLRVLHSPSRHLIPLHDYLFTSLQYKALFGESRQSYDFKLSCTIWLLDCELFKLITVPTIIAPKDLLSCIIKMALSSHSMLVYRWVFKCFYTDLVLAVFLLGPYQTRLFLHGKRTPS